MEEINSNYKLSKNILNICNKIKNETKEVVMVICIKNNRPVSNDIVAQGNAFNCNFEMGQIYNNVLKHNCSNYIVCHNHYIGKPEPSEYDDEVTSFLKEDSHLFDLNFIDHVIVADDYNEYFSYKEKEVI